MYASTINDSRHGIPGVARAFRTRELRAAGLSKHAIATAVEAGTLVRLHRGLYCPPDTDDGCQSASRLRGRLTCLSELRRLGVFVRDRPPLHVHVRSSSARLPAAPAGARVHREVLLREPHPCDLSVHPLDALRCAVQCQDPRASVATLDSALHLGLLRDDELDELFAALPRRYRRLRRLLDARMESGPETLMRLILRALGCRFDVQVRIDGVGRVDFVVDGWLIIECDSREFHSDWQAQVRDRERDLAAAAQGFVTLRVVAEHLLWKPDAVRAAVAGVLSGRPARPKAGWIGSEST